MTTDNVDLSRRNYDLATAAFMGMGLLCDVEIYFKINNAFTRRSGLYFWGLMLATTSLVIWTVATILNLWVLEGRIGWLQYLCSVPLYLLYSPGSFLVPYSRLRFLSASPRVLRWTLAAIVVEFISLEIPSVILILCCAFSTNPAYVVLYGKYWRVEVAGYTAVDFLLSALYLIEVRKMWGLNQTRKHRKLTRRILYMSLVIMAVDISAIITSHVLDEILSYSIQGFMCSFKLKFEVVTLNHLAKLAKTKMDQAQQDFGFMTESA